MTPAAKQARAYATERALHAPKKIPSGSFVGVPVLNTGCKTCDTNKEKPKATK